MNALMANEEISAKANPSRFLVCGYLAIPWSESDQIKRELADQTGISRTRITEARVVLKYAPELAKQVLLVGEKL
jgi:hypothetical protein